MIQSIMRQTARYCPKFIKRFLRNSGFSAFVEERFFSDVSNKPYEPDVSNLIQQVVQPGWVCADVGANIGLITRLLARLVGPKGLVIAFEAHPENARVLNQDYKFLVEKKQIRVENLAVSDGSSKFLWLYSGRKRSHFEWNIVGHDVDGNKTEPEFQIPATSLDDYFPEGSQLNFVKIDVEGAEALVLHGMSRLLRQTRPILIIEFHDNEGWRGREELFDAGYILYDMQGKRLEPVNDIQSIFRCLALPREIEVSEATFNGLDGVHDTGDHRADRM